MNKDIHLLINEFNQFELFIRKNCLIYDCFLEYKNVVDLYIKGLFASHSIKSNDYDKLEYFGDHLLLQIVNHGDPKSIASYYLKYEIDKIKYKKTSEKDSFTEVIYNFFNQNHSIKERFNEEGNLKLFESINKIFSNILLLISICELEKEKEEIIDSLIVFLNHENILFPYSSKYLPFFIKKIGEGVDVKRFKSLFLSIINSHIFHEDKIIEAFSYVMGKRKIKFAFSEMELIKVEDFIFKKCPKCRNKEHSVSALIALYHIIENKELVGKIKKAIKLRTSDNYMNMLNAAAYGIISISEEEIDGIVSSVLPKKGEISPKEFLKRNASIEDRRVSGINHLINVCYKYGINTKNEQFVKIEEINNYYKWLCDIDNFDYDDFNPKWILEYPTRYYYKKFASSQLIKSKLENYLQNNYDSTVERHYLNIYVRRTWDVN